MVNNNRKVIWRLAKKTLSQRTKSIFMIFSIILVTFMLYTIFAVGFSYYDNYQVLTTRLQGSTANISFINPSSEQLEKLENLDYIEKIGLQTYCGNISSGESENSMLVLTNYSKTEWDNHIFSTIDHFEGKLPQQEYEIAMSKWTLTQLNIMNPFIGMKVELQCNTAKGVENGTFILTGIFDDYLLGTNNYTRSANVASSIFYFDVLGDSYEIYGNAIVSDAFASKKQYDTSKTVMITLKNTNSSSEEVLKQLKSDLSIDEGQMLMSFNNSESNTSGYAFILAALAIAIIIIMSGYFLISNIIRISVVKDIHYYGQLKTIGSTSKQLKAIVKRQVLIYGIVAAPIGIVLALISSLQIIPSVITTIVNGSSIDGILPVNTSFNLLIFVSTIMFVAITLWLSCLKPAKMASRISPVEAIKFNPVFTDKSVKSNRKNTSGCRLYVMAFRNVFGDKKKALSVYVSLFIGILAFLIVSTAFSHPDFEVMFDKQQPYAFEVKGNQMRGKETDINDDDVININAISEIDEIVPVKAITTLLYPDEEVLNSDLESRESFYGKNASYYINHPDEYKANIILISQEEVEEFAKLDMEFDIQSFVDGNAVIMSESTIPGETIGETISLLSEKTDGYLDFEICNAFVKGENYLDTAENYVVMNNNYVNVYISEKGIEKISSNISIQEIKIDADRKYDDLILEKLEELFNTKNVTIKSQKQTESTLKPMINSLKYGGMLFSSILIFAGILNFINVLVTNIDTRIKELSILEAIGMTKTQLKKLLFYEGLYYILGTILLISTIGIVITKLLVTMIHKVMYYFIYQYPIEALLLIFIIMLIICIVTIIVLYKNLSRRTVSERLKIGSE